MRVFIVCVLSALGLLVDRGVCGATCEWSQFRGPVGCGALPDFTWPSQEWPAGGPPVLWQSDPLPGDSKGGFASPVVSAGRVFLYVAWKKSRPIAERKLPGKDLDRIGICDGKVPADLVQKIEAARTSEERQKLDPKAVRAWVAKWVADNLTEEQRKTCGRFAEDRLNRGASAPALELLKKLQPLRDKLFPNQEALEKWFEEQQIGGATKESVVKLVPTEAEYTEDVVVALDAVTGKTLWQKAYPGRNSGWGASSTPCAAAGKVYVGSTTGQVYCFDAATGNEVWKAAPGKGEINPSFTLVDGLAVIQAGGLIAYSAQTGEKKWETKCGGGNGSPALWVAGGKKYLLVNGGKAACVDPADGRILWQVEGGGDSSPAALGDYMALNAKALLIYRISPEKAELVTKVEKGNRGSSPATDGQNVYAFSGGGLACTRAADGKVLWEVQVAKEDFGCPIMAGKRLLALSGDTVHLIGFENDQGKVLAKAKVDRLRCTTPALADGRLYIRSSKGVTCYALDPALGRKP